MSSCSAVQQGDEMACGRCGLRWPVDDTDPPQCLRHDRRSPARLEGLPPVPTRPLVTPERRTDPATRQRLEEQARKVDYRGLLRKYMAHMLGADGSTGVAWIGVEGRSYFSDALFSPEEVAALKACAGELEASD